jgi:LCP family protein required for cell wall assembly
MPSKRPDYRVHRARRGPIARLLQRRVGDRFSKLEERPALPARTPAGRGGFEPPPPQRPPGERRPEQRPGQPARPRKPITPGRVGKWVLIACAAWIALSVVLFFVSARVQSGKVSRTTKAQLDNSGNLLTSANNILVLGSDRRKGDQGKGRADTIMLMRYGGGHSARLSIPRDTLADIPGAGPSKINAAYAIGGAPLMIKTVKQYLGIEVNHVVEINFKGFPKFVNAMGGVNMTFDNCVRSRFEGRTVRFKKGKNHLDGQQALDAVRVRKNECDPSESDLTRARRQQKFLEAVKSRLYNPLLFPRWPWIAWRAPQAIRSDMGGGALMALYWDMQTSSSIKPQILEPTDPGANPLQVSDAEKQAKVKQFLAG